MGTPNEITLANLAGGALMEAATRELRRICENIADPNYPKDAKRKLQINLVIKPDDKGQMAAIEFDVKPTMPGPESGATVAYIAMAPGSDTISLYEVEAHPPLFGEEEDETPAVTPLTKRA